MKVQILEQIALSKRVLNPGEIIDIPYTLILKLGAMVKPIIPVLADDKSIIVLWRWFVVEADQVFRSSAKSADAWNRHQEYKQAAEARCRDGDIVAARQEFDKALKILRGIELKQPDLI